MFKKKSKFKLAREKAQAAIDKTNEKIDELGSATGSLYAQLTSLQELFDAIRNIPSEKKLQYEEIKQISLTWKQQAEKIERDYNAAIVKTAGKGAAGVALGSAVVTMGPTVAMGVATTFGVASTGTAISTLSGAAATNAALAWLGRGALAAGGGGMAAGKAFLALAGPAGWAIAGVALLTSGFFMWKSHQDKKRLEDVFTLISERDIKSYELAIVELSERITRISEESEKLKAAIVDVQTFGLDYNSMTETQQYALGSYVNLMSASTQLLVNPIMGLLPKYTEEDFEEYVSLESDVEKSRWFIQYKLLLISLANFLYKIDLDDKDKKLLWKSLKKNKKTLKGLGVSKKEFGVEVINTVVEALKYQYQVSKAQ